MKFLIIEDQALAMTVLRRQLQQKFPGCEVIGAENFKEGATALQEHKDIDYLFTDYQIGDPDAPSETVRCADFIKTELGAREELIRKGEDYQPIKGIFVHTAMSHLKFHEQDTAASRIKHSSTTTFLQGAMNSINTLMRLRYPIHLLEKSLDATPKMQEIEGFMQECGQKSEQARGGRG